MRLEKMLRAKAPRGTEGPLHVPQSFIEFCEWVGIEPRPGQREFIRVAYDGVEPVDRDLAIRIFGDIDFDHLPMGLRNVVAAVVGGRAGKTYLLIAVRLVWGMLVRDLSPLRDGQEAYATYVAPREDLREQILNYALGLCRKKPELRAIMRLPRNTKPDDTPSEFGLYRADFDRVVTFRGTVASRGGVGVRGAWHTDLALDEAAFFRDASYRINDVEIFKAGRPRVLKGGQLIVASTPYARTGLLWDLYRENFATPKNAIVAHAPTTVLNDDEYIRGIVEAERERDPDNAKHEYDAEFVEAGTLIFFESTSLDEIECREPFALQPGDKIAAGGDLGFVGDSSALVFVALRGEEIHVFDVIEMRPDGRPLDPDETCETFADKMRAVGCSYIMTDKHYVLSLISILNKHGLNHADAGPPDESYVRARQLMRARRVKIYGDRFEEGVMRRLMQQLREVQGRPRPGGGMQIVQPRWAKGGHGDLCSALVLALLQVTGPEVAAKEPDRGTKEWEAARREERQRAMVEAMNSPTDRGRGAYWRRAG